MESKTKNIIIGIILFLVSILLIWFTFSDTTPDTAPEFATYTLTENDKSDIEDVSESFIRTISNYGYMERDSDGLLTEAAEEYFWNDKDNLPKNDEIYLDRITSYNKSKSFILENGPLYYPGNIVNNWYNVLDDEYRATYSVNSYSIVSTIPDSTTVYNENRPIVEIEYNLVNSVITETYPSDTPVDGSEYVLTPEDILYENIHDDIFVKIVFIKDSAKWKVYDMDTNKPYLFSTWRNPSNDNNGAYFPKTEDGDNVE